MIGIIIVLTGRLYVKSTTSPNSLDIRATFDQYAFEIVRVNDLLIDNIELTQCQTTALHVQSCDGATITNCNFHDIRGEVIGTLGTTANLVVNDNTFERIDLRGVFLSGVATAEFKRNVFNEIGTSSTVGFPTNANLTTGAGICWGINDASGPLINSDIIYDENIFTNIAYNAIQHWGPDFEMTRNIIDTYGTFWSDGGGFHLIYRTVGASSTSNGLIQNNNIRNGTTSSLTTAIYIDNGCNDIIINENSVEGTLGEGILINWDCKDITVTNNRVTGSTNYALGIRQDTDAADSPVWPNTVGNIVTGNILTIRNNTGRPVQVKTFNSNPSYNPFSSGGDSDSNHYVNPYGVNIAHYTNVSTHTNHTLATWRTLYSDDAASTSRTNYITYSNATNALQEIKMEFNDTDTPVNFNVPAGYSDEEGNAFSNPVSIPAYSALIYFKDTAYP